MVTTLFLIIFLMVFFVVIVSGSNFALCSFPKFALCTPHLALCKFPTGMPVGRRFRSTFACFVLAVFGATFSWKCSESRPQSPWWISTIISFRITTRVSSNFKSNMKRMKRKCRSLFLILMMISRHPSPVVPASAPISLSQGKIRIFIRIKNSTVISTHFLMKRKSWGCTPA